MVLAVAEAAAAAAAEPESTDSMEHCRYESAEAWRRGERSRALQSDDHSITMASYQLIKGLIFNKVIWITHYPMVERRQGWSGLHSFLED